MANQSASVSFQTLLESALLQVAARREVYAAVAQCDLARVRLRDRDIAMALEVAPGPGSEPGAEAELAHDPGGSVFPVSFRSCHRRSVSALVVFTVLFGFLETGS